MCGGKMWRAAAWIGGLGWASAFVACGPAAETPPVPDAARVADAGVPDRGGALGAADAGVVMTTDAGTRVDAGRAPPQDPDEPSTFEVSPTCPEPGTPEHPLWVLAGDEVVELWVDAGGRIGRPRRVAKLPYPGRALAIHEGSAALRLAVSYGDARSTERGTIVFRRLGTELEADWTEEGRLPLPDPRGQVVALQFGRDDRLWWASAGAASDDHPDQVGLATRTETAWRSEAVSAVPRGYPKQLAALSASEALVLRAGPDIASGTELHRVALDSSRVERALVWQQAVRVPEHQPLRMMVDAMRARAFVPTKNTDDPERLNPTGHLYAVALGADGLAVDMMPFLLPQRASLGRVRPDGAGLLFAEAYVGTYERETGERYNEVRHWNLMSVALNERGRPHEATASEVGFDAHHVYDLAFLHSKMVVVADGRLEAGARVRVFSVDEADQSWRPVCAPYQPPHSVRALATRPSFGASTGR